MAIEGQAVGRNQQAVAELRDAQSIIRQSRAAVKERPPR
jgi:hypothetical protein